MKKTLAIIAILTLVMTSVFATANGSSASGDATLDLSLNIAASEVESYTIGFTTAKGAPNIDSNKFDTTAGLPSAATSLALDVSDLDKADGIITNSELSIFWKFRSASDVTLKVTGTPLTSNNKTINYNLTLGSGDASPSATGVEKSLSFSGGYSSGMEKLTITTTTPYTADLAASDYTALLTLTIAGA